MVGRTRVYQTGAERQKAYRERKRLKKLKDHPSPIIREEIIQPDLVDTRDWSWEYWCAYFLDMELLDHQIENLEAFENHQKVILNDPRQHGKTNFVAKPFIIRKLCESVFRDIDEPILYISHSLGAIELFTMAIVEEIIINPRIIDNYGDIIDFTTVKKKSLKKQTQTIINVKRRHSKVAHSYMGKSTGAKIRGAAGIRYTIIDDPIDLHREDDPDDATKRFLNWLRYKITPFTRGGSIIIIGTRYSIKDLYVILGESKLYYIIKRAAIKQIFLYTPIHPAPWFEELDPIEYDFGLFYKIIMKTRPLMASDIHVENEDEWELLAPSLWENAFDGSAVQNIVYQLVDVGNIVFQQELQNNPIPLEPLIKYGWFQDYQQLVHSPEYYTWVVFVDVAAGESKGADYTAMVLVGEKDNRYHIHDIIYGKWTGKEKQEKLEQFIRDKSEEFGRTVSERDIRVLIETVLNQRDFFQRIRDESYLTPKPISPAKRRDKITRITHGLGQEMENKLVWLNVECRNKAQLRTEVEGFPIIQDEHILDATDQAIYFIKKHKRHPRVKFGYF